MIACAKMLGLLAEQRTRGNACVCGINPCPGVGFPDDSVPGGIDWREGCEDCARKNSANPNALPITPPEIITFECAFRIPKGES